MNWTEAVAAQGLGDELAESWRLRCAMGKEAPLRSMAAEGEA